MKKNIIFLILLLSATAFAQPKISFVCYGSSLPASSLNTGCRFFVNTSTNIPYFWNGTSWVQFLGNVSSVGLSMPDVIFNASVTNSPVTTSGTLTPTLKTQNANTVFAGPTSGGAATPTMRALVTADLPSSAILNGGNAGAITLGSNDNSLSLETNGTTRLSIPSSGINVNAAATKALMLNADDSLYYNVQQSGDFTATVTQSGSDTLLNGAIGYGHFTRVGNIVTFTLRIEMALTVTGNANTVYIDPPIASNFTTAASDVIGVAGLDSQGLSSANTPKQRALLFASDSDDKIGISFDPVASLAYPENRVYISASGTYIIQ